MSVKFWPMLVRFWFFLRYLITTVKVSKYLRFYTSGKAMYKMAEVIQLLRYVLSLWQVKSSGAKKKVWSVDHLLKCKISDFCQSSQFAIICRHTMYRTIAVSEFQDYKLTLHLDFLFLNCCLSSNSSASINKISIISQFFFWIHQ